MIFSVLPAARARSGKRKAGPPAARALDRKSTRLNSSHQIISYAVFCLKKKKYQNANNSVLITDSFVKAVETGSEWNLTARTDSSVIETVNAKKLMRDLHKAAKHSSDPY